MLLDDAKTIARLDKGNVRASIDALPDQVGDAWREASSVSVPKAFRNVTNIVVAGMGGSTLGAHLIQSVMSDTIRVPFSFVNDYHLPASVGKKSLVILSSYSGTTEETLSCFKEAKARGAKIMGITTGGPLARMLRAAHAPSYIFKPKHNPSKQPRMGVGYLVTGTLALLAKAGLAKVNVHEMNRLPSLLMSRNALWNMSALMRSNQAKLLANTLHRTVPIFVAGGHLVGNAHIFQNQIQESAKQFCTYFPLPELNHHLMEGLQFPKEIRGLLAFVFLNSKLYEPKLYKRLDVTQIVVGKQGYDFHSFTPTAPTKLGQAYETLAFGSAVSFYMAMLARVNPSNIPWVDFFKKRLAQG
jgi:glucose/mannose-6-phosphate isomerase